MLGFRIALEVGGGYCGLGVLLYYVVYCWVVQRSCFWCLFAVGLLFLGCLFVVCIVCCCCLLFVVDLCYWLTFNSVDIYVFEFVVLI